MRGELRSVVDQLGAPAQRLTLHVDGHELPVTNLDKPLFHGRDGEPPVTKRELVAYAAGWSTIISPVSVILSCAVSVTVGRTSMRESFG